MAPPQALSFLFSLHIYKAVFAAAVEIPGESIKGKQEPPVGRRGETESNNCPLAPIPSGSKVKAEPASFSPTLPLFANLTLQASFQNYLGGAGCCFYEGSKVPSIPTGKHRPENSTQDIYTTIT